VDGTGITWSIRFSGPIRMELGFQVFGITVCTACQDVLHLLECH